MQCKGKGERKRSIGIHENKKECTAQIQIKIPPRQTPPQCPHTRTLSYSSVSFLALCSNLIYSLISFTATLSHPPPPLPFSPSFSLQSQILCSILGPFKSTTTTTPSNKGACFYSNHLFSFYTNFDFVYFSFYLLFLLLPVFPHLLITMDLKLSILPIIFFKQCSCDASYVCIYKMSSVLVLFQ